MTDPERIDVGLVACSAAKAGVAGLLFLSCKQLRERTADMTYATAPAINTRVVVDNSLYGNFDDMTGTVVEITPALTRCYANIGQDPAGTVWVYLDEQRDRDATSGYAKSEPVGFDPSNLRPAVVVGTPALDTDADRIEHEAKCAS